VRRKYARTSLKNGDYGGFRKRKEKTVSFNAEKGERAQNVEKTCTI
jgi:hypothetical protein